MQRLPGTIATHTIGILAGADIVRAHDVSAAVQAARVTDRLREMQYMSFYTISIHQLALYAHHGVFAEEKVLGQRFLLDITLRVNATDALIDDDIVRSVSYAHVIEETKTAFTAQSYNMIETAADRLASHLLARCD